VDFSFSRGSMRGKWEMVSATRDEGCATIGSHTPEYEHSRSGATYERGEQSSHYKEFLFSFLDRFMLRDDRAGMDFFASSERGKWELFWFFSWLDIIVLSYYLYMQEETLTFEEIQELRARREHGEYVPSEVMEAYFTIKSFLETKDVTKV